MAVDDTLFRRRGQKVWAVSWFHDGSVPGPAKTGYGNNWVIAAVVRLPMISRPVAIPVLAKLLIKGTSSASRLGWPPHGRSDSRRAARPGHPRGGRFLLRRRRAEKLPARVTWTTRLRKDAALYGLPPARTGKRGRPRERGDRLPSLAKLAATADFAPVTVTRYGKTATVHAAVVTWPVVAQVTGGPVGGDRNTVTSSAWGGYRPEWRGRVVTPRMTRQECASTRAKAIDTVESVPASE